MEGGILDILIFAMIAAFLVLRLRNVLGRRTGNEQRRDDSVFQPRPHRQPEPGNDDATDTDNVIALPDRTNGIAGGKASGLTQIKVADPRFDEHEFLKGARMAFEMIVTAFSNGDRDTLRALTSREVLENLELAIEERERKGHVLESTLVGIGKVEMVEAEMAGSEARVTIRIESEQVNVTRDAEGQIVAGSEAAVEKVTDVWVFARDTQSADPNWSLIETHTPDA